VVAPQGHEALGGWNISVRIHDEPSPECLLILGPMRYSDACSPPDEQIIIIEKNAKKHADHRRCRRDGCLLRYHRAEREREVWYKILCRLFFLFRNTLELSRAAELDLKNKLDCALLSLLVK
jgi:hypothetical protein